MTVSMKLQNTDAFDWILKKWVNILFFSIYLYKANLREDCKSRSQKVDKRTTNIISSQLWDQPTANSLSYSLLTARILIFDTH